MSDLAKRAVACKHWRWMPGMSTDGMLVVDADDTGLSIVRKDTIQDHWAPEDALPDLTDTGTKGCVLALAREAWGDPHLHASYVRPGSNPDPSSPYHPCWMVWRYVPYGRRRVGRGAVFCLTKEATDAE